MGDRIRAGLLAAATLSAMGSAVRGEVPTRPPSRPGPRSLAAAGTPDPARFLAAFARARVEDRSGDVVFVPRPGVYFSGGWGSYNHGSPWDYDTRVPLCFYGPGQIRRRGGEGPEPEPSPRDVAPTLAMAVGLPVPATMDGRVLGDLFVPGRPVPRALLVVVMDQVGAADVERFAAKMPHLTRWRREGADFPRARLDYLPSYTAVSHATVGTGALPSAHGINNNMVPDPARKKVSVVIRNGDGGVDPAMVRVPTLAELLDEAHGNRAVVVASVSAEYAAVSLAGRGAGRPGGDHDVVVWYDARTGSPATDPRWYRIPEWLAARSVRDLIETYGPLHRGNPVGNLHRIKESPRFARWEADHALALMVREGVGADAIPDLVMVNLKSTDGFGHTYGHDAPGYAECLAEVDRFLGAAERLLAKRTGPGGFVAAVTADHGLVPDDGARRSQEELAAELGTRLAGRGRPGASPVLAVEGYHVFLDRDVLAARGLAAADVAAALREDPDVAWAWTDGEVAAAAGTLPAR